MTARSMRALRGAAALLAFAAIAIAIRAAVAFAGGPEGLVAEAGPAGPLVIGLAQAALAPLPFPSEVFTLASSAAYGFCVGTVVTWLAWTLGSMLQYVLAKRGASEAGLEERLARLLGDRAEGRARLPAALRRIPLEHPAFLVAVRWLPMGFHVANIGAALRGVPATTQLWTAALGSLPVAAIWAAIGAGLLGAR